LATPDVQKFFGSFFQKRTCYAFFMFETSERAIDAARTARLRFTQAGQGLKTLFPTLPLCPPR
jgi:hypothetical protein